MKFSAIVLDDIQRFAIVPMESILNRLRLVYHQLSIYHQLSQPKRKRKKAMNQIPPMAQEIQDIKQTFYCGSGVGVYRGEAVTLQEWALSNPTQWVIGKLRASDSHLFEKGVVCELLQTALILAHYLQSEPVKNHLQNLDEISLSHNCPYTRGQKTDEPSLPEQYESAECPLQNLMLRKLKLLISQYSGEFPRCPFERIIDLLNQGLNHSGTEPCRKWYLPEHSWSFEL